MTQTFFFYDLETSGLNAREDRIMQFAGRRTDLDLNPIGDPVNILVRLNDDTLPSPDALMVTGITPQKTIDEGYSEAEFSKMLVSELFTPGTTVIGFNNVRFDDEFIRHLLWRNFYDPYEWSWKDGRSRWDMLDVVRMTRALRPEGINWPVDDSGKPTNRLELITKVNNISHENAHDALSDVDALISVTQLIKTRQPKLFDYLLKMRDKKMVQNLVNLEDKKPFVYSSGRYDNEWNKTTVAFPLSAGPNSSVLVYDLRYDPSEFVGLSESELSKKVFASYEERLADDYVKLPVKTLQYNRCPAVAPIGVLESDGAWQKIGLSEDLVNRHLAVLLANPDFAERLRSVFDDKPEFTKSTDSEARLYDGFLNDKDRTSVEAVRNSDEKKLADFHPDFADDRLAPLLLHYKARNFPQVLGEAEMAKWEEWRADRLKKQMPVFIKNLSRLSTGNLDGNQQFILQELQLWAEAILPGSE